MKLRILFSIFALACLPSTASAKDWRNITPLKSTRTDVERRFGKPDEWGGYDFRGERVSFVYGDEPCKGLYLTLGKDNCKCLADEGAVMSILVKPTVTRRFSTLMLDKKNFKKIPISPFPHTFAYENPTEGIVYTVDELEDEIMHITYYPSPVDCQDIVNKRGPTIRNSWRGLVPLRSSRRDVETLLGSRSSGPSTLVNYKTDYESIVAKYSGGICDASTDWRVPKDTLIELVINPNPSFLLRELHLDSSRYQRREIFPYPEIDNPPRVWYYVDELNGIVIRTQSSRGGGGEELVVSISYLPAKRDEKLHCKQH